MSSCLNGGLVSLGDDNNVLSTAPASKLRLVRWIANTERAGETKVGIPEENEAHE